MMGFVAAAPSPACCGEACDDVAPSAPRLALALAPALALALAALDANALQN